MTFYLTYLGDEVKIKDKIKKYNINQNHVSIIHTNSVVSDEETPLTAIKNSKILACGIV